METSNQPPRFDMRNTVEREPMWDGNILASLENPFGYLVEREPMWDGNKKSGK